MRIAPIISGKKVLSLNGLHQNFFGRLRSLFTISNDTFQRSHVEGRTFAPIQSRKDAALFFKKPCNEITKETFDSLTAKEYDICTDFVRNEGELYGTGEEVAMYGEYVKAGLDTLFKGKQYKLIGIGQSPTSILEYLRLEGVDTATMPISYLRLAPDSYIQKITNSNDFQTYLRYVKNFGFDKGKLSPDITYVFTDYKSSGATIRQFEKLISPHIQENIDCRFIPLQDLSRASQISEKENNMLINFETEILNGGYFKLSCSPIFKLPFLDIGKIETLHKNSIGSDENKNFNILKLFLYDMLYKRNSKLKKKMQI